jgi:Flp pilus assembly protein TadG
LRSVVEEMMMLQLRMASGAGRPEFWRRHARTRDGDAAVACAAAVPLLALALAVGADYAGVSHFRNRLQLAADAASLAATGAVARHPYGAVGSDVDELADRVAEGVFAVNAPRGAAGTPTVETRSRAPLVTTIVGYQGVAPSNFGSALGYGAVSVDASATSHALIADSRRIAAH